MIKKIKKIRDRKGPLGLMRSFAKTPFPKRNSNSADLPWFLWIEMTDKFSANILESNNLFDAKSCSSKNPLNLLNPFNPV